MKRSPAREQAVRELLDRLTAVISDGAEAVDALDALAMCQFELLATTAPNLQQALNLQRSIHKAICTRLRFVDGRFGIPAFRANKAALLQ